MAGHLSSFWELDMRVDLVRAVNAGSVTVDEVVQRAVARLPVAI